MFNKFTLDKAEYNVTYFGYSSGVKGFLAFLAVVGIFGILIGVLLAIMNAVSGGSEKLIAELGKNAGVSRNTVCPQCGLAVSPGVKVCPNCGNAQLENDTENISALVNAAEKNGSRTAAAVPCSGNRVVIQQKLDELLRGSGYFQTQNASGEDIWQNSKWLLFIKYEFTKSFVILSGFITLGGAENNLSGYTGIYGKKKVLNVMLQMKEIILKSGS